MRTSAHARGVAAVALSLIGFVVACGGGTDDGHEIASASLPVAASSAPTDDALPVLCAARRSPTFEPAAAPGASSSAIDVVRVAGRTHALVADADERALHVVDARDMKEIGVTPLEGRPEHVLAGDDGRIFVTLRDKGTIIALEPTDAEMRRPFEVRCSTGVGAEPLAIARAGDRLLVTSAFDQRLVILSGGDLSPIAAVGLPREPRGILVDGPRAFIAHAVGANVSVIDLAALEKPVESVSLRLDVRPEPRDPSAKPKPPVARGTSQGYALASLSGARADGSKGTLRLFVPNATSDTGPPESASAGYGGTGGGFVRAVSGFVAVVDPAALKMISTEAMANATVSAPEDCVLPRSVVASGSSLFVACLDAGTVLELDARVADPMTVVRRRFAAPGGPSAVALDGEGALFAYASFDRVLSRFDLAGDRAKGGKETSLWRRSGAQRDAVVERGRLLFHTSRDARIGGGRACAGCHPEGRDDGLVWSSPDGPRQTPMLAGRVQGSAPYGWFGENPTLDDHLMHTFVRLGGTGFDAKSRLSATDEAALEKYVASLELPKRLVPAKLAERVERGKDVYVAYGCQGCHVDGKSDNKRHDVGSGADGERRAAFDTPWLLGVASSAPYFHDGRYASLDDLLSAKDSRMFTGTISAPDREALVAYLGTL